MSDPARQDLQSLSEALRQGRLTSEALVAACLARVRRMDKQFNSFVAVDGERARAASRDSDARLRAGAARSPLEGIPISVKDNILVAGMPATWGTRALAGFVPDVDELPVAKLRAAGAIIVGKTNVPELTLEGYTANEMFGVTRNPWDTRLTPGGSSGGAAASVAAGLVPAALGTDGGGSIRRPASHTGLVGFKPSTGRVARIDGFPAILSDFETIGTLTRTVADAAMLGGLAGPDPRDRRSEYAAAPPWDAGRRRILYISRFGQSPVDQDVAEATESVAALLAAAGHEVVPADVFFDTQSVARIWHVVSRAGVAWLAAQDGGRIGESAGPTVRAMIADGAKLSGADYVDALEQVTALRRRCAEMFSDVHLVLTPTAAALPWAADRPFPDMIAGVPAGPRDHAVFTGWVNVAGLPAISLPVAVSRGGLPIGVQFIAGFGNDVELLDFSAWFETQRRPPPLPEL